jgi:UPF0176 protein
MSLPAYRIAALYHFGHIEDLEVRQRELKTLCVSQGVCGTLILAEEGINGTIGGPAHGIEAVLDAIRVIPGFEGLDVKESWSEEEPFLRMKVRIKAEIVTMGAPHADPRERVGEYVKPEDWNALISEPGVMVIDTRNHYESRIGTFEGSILPGTDNFREFPDWVAANADTLKGAGKIAMFCTGGIRCERATAFMLNQGFENVYHLHGGILKYLEHIPKSETKWEGDCFVFDQRVSVQHGLKEGNWDLCHACREPIDETHKASADFELGVSCPLCIHKTSEEQKRGYRERQKQQRLARERNQVHIGVNPRSQS